MTIKRVFQWIQSEIILVIAAVAALISCFFVPVSIEYLSYIDVRTLSLLFCLMIIIAGVQKCGVFESLAQRLLSGNQTLRILQVILVMVPFFASMLITNDVALITFVPFTISILEMAKEQQKIPWILVLQTMAANLGSMATPIGNPQNIYLCGFFQIGMPDFFRIVAPTVVLSALILAALSLVSKNKNIQVEFLEKLSIHHNKTLLVLMVLFCLCLLSVFRILPHLCLIFIVCGVLLVVDRELFCRVDYILLLTFVFFFIFAGNLSRIEEVRTFLQSLMEQSTLITSILASQIFSNVPAAILLSNFTNQASSLLLGVNLGGLGTPIASLASLITIKYYLRSKGANLRTFFFWFTIMNFALLLILYLFT